MYQAALKSTEGMQGETIESGLQEGVYNKKNKFDRRSKTYYNEYQTFAMKWANATDRIPGDTTILNKNGKQFVLIEATGDGYVEIAKGSYKAVKETYERLYTIADDEIYGNLEGYETDKGSGTWDMQFYEEGRNGDGDTSEVEREEVQNKPSRNNEYLHGGNQGEFVNSETENDVLKSKPDTAADETITPPKIRTTAQKTQAAFKLKEEVQKKLEQQTEKYGDS